eukprot:TRINITY_DN6773_c0_g1_i3.p1 TRINITY_DN6773_c0_g1~~TRINITY_DN6773_c0_g1_i3.p1  ORF type:complete len:1019 (-),score=496.25 TRINITY_DN6773_c0_g1_i3:92-3148(-)
MFIYLSKKIAIPKDVRLRSLSWNTDQGWIACGGESGMLKVLKLESQPTSNDPKAKGLAAPSNLSMNQTLEGHTGAVECVVWNEVHRKLTTSDDTGLIIVWMLYKGMWYEEMINNRNKSVVRDMKWTSDGQKICIIYEDGAVIVGSVDGNRIWGKELGKVNLSKVCWSPDTGRHILFCTDACEILTYDALGNFVANVPIQGVAEGEQAVEIVGIDWYDGSQGYVDPNAPSLAVAFSNGRIQLMRNEVDEKALIIETGLRISRIKWNCAGTVLAVSGASLPTEAERKALEARQRDGEDKPDGDQPDPDKESNAVQFYTPFGRHLRSLKVPGTGINGLSWEGSGLRIALAVDSFIYFANIRPDYKWGYFGKTLVYAYTKPERSEHCVVFWETKTDERHVKYVKKLVAIRAAGDNCCLVTKTEDGSDQWILILCNAIGTPIDSKYTEVEPINLSMTGHHVVVASEDYVYVWQYRSMLTSADPKVMAGASLRKDGKDKMFHIDDLGIQDPKQSDKNVAKRAKEQYGLTTDPICCTALSARYLVVGRESGNVHRYVLPEIKYDCKFALKSRPQQMAFNCDSTRIAVIDANGVLNFLDADTKQYVKNAPVSTLASLFSNAPVGAHLPFERKDVWDMKWSDDNPNLFSMMEKTRMYIFRGLDVEEPIPSSGYICQFNNLKVKSVMLDEIMQNPEHPNIKEMVLRFETKSLRDTRELLQSVGLKEAFQFISDNPHNRLWRLMAEAALERLDFITAEKAFVRGADYQGIQFVKRLKVLDDKLKQKAEVAAYFKNFDQAENIYRDIDRKDLAIDLRMRLGDWFRVVQLLQSGGGDDHLLGKAWNNIGDYYAERYKWASAVQYYAQAKNYERLAHCYYVLEDYNGLEDLIHTLSEGDPLLISIGQKFATVGMSDHAVRAFLKAGDIKAAIDCCITLNQWDVGVKLAGSNEFAQVETLLTKYAQHLLEKQKPLHAVELYRKSNHHIDAAKLLFKLGKESGVKGKFDRAKKLYVIGALEVRSCPSGRPHDRV